MIRYFYEVSFRDKKGIRHTDRTIASSVKEAIQKAKRDRIPGLTDWKAIRLSDKPVKTARPR